MLPALAVGGVYRAEVVRLMADGRARMSVGGREVQAHARTALVEGETVWVEVERLQPEVVLRIRARQGASIGRQKLPCAEEAAEGARSGPVAAERNGTCSNGAAGRTAER